jgi:WD40 repeat protein
VATTGLFDGQTGNVIVDGLEGPTVTAIAPSGELIASVAGRITRHDPETLARTGTIPGARGEVNSLQISRDGRTMLATANDETVSLYDLPSGIRLGDPIPASAPLIGQGALRPDGLQFVVNVKDGIQVWDADPQHQFAAVCRLAGRELSTEERATYLAALPHATAACSGILD